MPPRIHLSSPHLGSLERGFVDDAFASNWIAPLGPHVEAFQEEFARYVGAPHALALSSPPDQPLRERLSSLIAAHQAPDGTWPTADLFHTLEALLTLRTAEARNAVHRAIPVLLSRQRIDGTFGSTAQQERALIALRSLIWAEQEG